MATHALAGKTVLITGAAKRIGRATALAFAAEGANIAVHYRASEEEAGALINDIRKLGVEAWAVQADFENPEEYETLVERAVSAAGSLDILVNSASIFPHTTVDELTFSGMMKNMEVNAWVPFALSREFARRVRHGAIVNLLDSRVKDGDANHAGYILSKRVLEAFTEMMALAFAPKITVNAVAPGLILPPPGKDESYLRRLAGTVPLKRHGGAEDIAEAIVFLAKSKFITGEVIFVDGGRHLKEYPGG